MTKSFGVPTQQQQTHNNPTTCHLSSPPTSTNCSQAKQKWGKEISSWTFLFF
jgi:hypothetical protein